MARLGLHARSSMGGGPHLVRVRVRVRVLVLVRVRVRVRVEGWGAHEDHRVLVGHGHVVAQHVLVDEAGRVLPAGALGHAVHRVPYVDALIGGDRVELLLAEDVVGALVGVEQLDAHVGLRLEQRGGHLLRGRVRVRLG